jgi:serine/threonine-protein kinase PRP4
LFSNLGADTTFVPASKAASAAKPGSNGSKPQAHRAVAAAPAPPPQPRNDGNSAASNDANAAQLAQPSAAKATAAQLAGMSPCTPAHRVLTACTPLFAGGAGNAPVSIGEKPAAVVAAAQSSSARGDEKKVLASASGSVAPAASTMSATTAVDVDRVATAAAPTEPAARQTQLEMPAGDGNMTQAAGVVPDAAAEAAANRAKVSQSSVADDFDMFSAEPIAPMEHNPMQVPRPPSHPLTSCTSWLCFTCRVAAHGLAGAPTQGHVARNGGTRTPIPDLLAEDSTDSTGYYHVQPGETLCADRFRVTSEIGRGVFSCVIACTDTQAGNKAVAIKIIKNNETMKKAAEKELDILTRIKADDPQGRKHNVSMLMSFEHKEHICMVFERYEMDLRQVLKKFGRGVGIKLDAIRVYGAQMLTALAQMKKLGIVHADIKPDNVLVTADKKKIVIADMGSAGLVSECEITPYLVSRYYRAPEISLGHAYGCEIDVWAVACTICEMYTGRFLFDGETNNHMLKLIQEVRGGISNKMVRQSKLSSGHFDEDNSFLAQPTRKSKDKKIRKMRFDRPTRDLFALLCPPESVRRMTSAQIARVQLFKDLLERMLVLDPSKRATPEQLLTSHPFFQRSSSKQDRAK